MLNHRLLAMTSSLTIVVAVLVSLPRTAAQQKSAGKPDNKANKTLFDDCERTAQQIADLGPKLIEVLDNPNASITDRLKAATLLGRLKYPPGIPVLIKYAGLFDKFKITSDGPDYNCIDALAEYGDAAVPAVVDAFLATSPDDQIPEHWLLSVVNDGKLGKVALPYCKGLAPDKPNPDFDKKLVLLKNYLGIK